MECHEIGERFEHDGVVLEVMQYHGNQIPCTDCYFRYFSMKDFDCGKTLCRVNERKDGKNVYYKPVEQYKTKDMEQKKEIIKRVEGMDKVFATHVGNVQSDEEIYGSLLDKLFTTYKAKDADYGSAFAEMFDELGIDYAYGKLREKMNRIKVLRNKPNMVENEGLEDALLDTAGYAILTLVELKKRKGDGKSE